jgi:uncharacterized membrane protein
MAKVQESIEVNVPVRTAYNQWTQFEEFPRFMEGVEQVVQIDDTTLEWTAQVFGQDKQWRAQITDQTPDRKVAWRSVGGAENAGTVEFEPMGSDQTRVSVTMEVDPEGPLENVGTALGFLQRRVQGDLGRFKEFIEARGQETGAWRGEVRSAQAMGHSGGADAAGSAPGSMGTSGTSGTSGTGGSGGSGGSTRI